jgi:predicted ribosomally synthesized peptide with nif11-like leader
MSIHNAIYLLNAIENDTKLRGEMYRCNNNEELKSFLKATGFIFSNDEFEEAVNSLHVQCQTLEQAQLLLQKADWLRYMIFINEKISD